MLFRSIGKKDIAVKRSIAKPSIARCRNPKDCMCFYHQAIRQGACPKKLDDMREQLAKAIAEHDTKEQDSIVDAVVNHTRINAPELGWTVGQFLDYDCAASFGLMAHIACFVVMSDLS